MQVFSALVAVSAFGASAFPLQSLELTQAVVNQLNTSAPGEATDALATSLLLPGMQGLFASDSYQLEVLQSDYQIHQTFPGQTVDNSCEHKIDVLNPVATGEAEKSSYLKYGVSGVNWKGLTVFVDGQLDAELGVSLGIDITTGVHVFHHCKRIAGKRVDLTLSSDGHVGLGINMTASNAHVAFVAGQLSLVFNFHASVVGTVLQWNVDKVMANGCKIKVLGIEILNICGKVRDAVKNAANQYAQHAVQISIPALLQRLQDKINTAIGAQVVIPIRIAADEAQQTVVV